MTMRLQAAAAFMLLLAGAGCSFPLFTARPLVDEQGWLVRVETYGDPGRSAQVQLDHPSDLTEADLTAILSRVLIQDKVGLLQKTASPQPIFAPAETEQFAPALRRAFQSARSTEWVTFTVTNYDGPAPAVTSGAFFIKDRRLHVVIANWREAVASGRDGVGAVRASPLRPIKQRDRVLDFEKPPYVVSVADSWMGGYAGPAASEMVLDHASFLAALRAQARQPVSPAPPPDRSTAESEPDAAKLRQQVSALQDENARLKRQLEEQAAELTRLKARAAGQKAKPPAKNSVK